MKNKVFIISGMVFLLSLIFVSAMEVSVNIREKYQNVQAGETLHFYVVIKNIEKAGRHDIALEYFVKKNDITIASSKELKAVETQTSFLSSIKIPEEMLPGLYNLEIVVNEKESSSATFYITSSESSQIKLYLLLILIAILVVGVIISWEIYKFTKALNPNLNKHPDKTNLSKEFKNLSKDSIVSVIVPSEDYEKASMYILNQFISKEKKPGIYITMNRPYKNIIELMKKNNINVKKLFFIDCISKEITESKDKANCIFVKSPENLTGIAVAIDKLFEPNKHGFIFFDSLDALLVHNTPGVVMKFMRFITSKMRIYGIKGVLLGLHEKTTEELIKRMGPFTDKTIKLV